MITPITGRIRTASAHATLRPAERSWRRKRSTRVRTQMRSNGMTIRTTSSMGFLCVVRRARGTKRCWSREGSDLRVLPPRGQAFPDVVRDIVVRRDHADRQAEMLEAMREIVVDPARQVSRLRADDDLVELVSADGVVDGVEGIGPGVEALDLLVRRVSHQPRRLLLRPIGMI